MSKKRNKKKDRKRNISHSLPVDSSLPASIAPSPVSMYDQLITLELERWTQARAHAGKSDKPLLSTKDEGTAKALALLGLNVWRLKKRLFDENNEPIDGMSMACRHFDEIKKALAELKLEIIDKTGDMFDQGLVQRAIAYEPTPGLTRETIVQTVKPTLFLDGELIERGDVIVGTPMTDSSSEEKTNE